MPFYGMRKYIIYASLRSVRECFKIMIYIKKQLYICLHASLRFFYGIDKYGLLTKYV